MKLSEEKRAVGLRGWRFKVAGYRNLLNSPGEALSSVDSDTDAKVTTIALPELLYRQAYNTE